MNKPLATGFEPFDVGLRMKDGAPPPKPRSQKAVARVATTPGAETLSDKALEHLAALPRKQRRAKLAELKRSYAKAVKRAKASQAAR